MKQHFLEYEAPKKTAAAVLWGATRDALSGLCGPLVNMRRRNKKSDDWCSDFTAVSGCDLKQEDECFVCPRKDPTKFERVAFEVSSWFLSAVLLSATMQLPRVSN